MKTKLIAALATALVVLAGAAHADEKIVVIVNAKNAQTLSADDVKNIYNDNVVTWSNGASIAVLEPSAKSDARETFARKILGTSARDAATDWANKKITNTAKNPPVSKPDSVVVNSVIKDENAIGYVFARSVEGKQGIRVVLTVE